MYTYLTFKTSQMKADILRAASCLFILFIMIGCSQENQVVEPENEGVQLSWFNTTEQTSTPLTVDITDLTKFSLDTRNNQVQIAVGNYVGPLGSNIRFGAIDYNNQVQGRLNLTGDFFGTIIGRPLCISTNDDDEAVVAYLLERVDIPYLNIVENGIVWIKYKDNGYGNSGTSDQVSELVLTFPNWDESFDSPEEVMSVLGCGAVFDFEGFGSFIDVEGNLTILSSPLEIAVFQ